jgi:hypothetical protein
MMNYEINILSKSIEDITRVGLTTGRTTKKERHLTVSDGLLRQVIVDDKSCRFSQKNEIEPLS